MARLLLTIMYRYHYLNHYAIFAGGYKGSAMSIMKSLLAKYHSKG
jgi:protein-ribulosamine 3-kinase